MEAVVNLAAQTLRNQPPLPATSAGILLAAGCAGAVAIAVYRTLSSRPTAHRTMQAIASGGLTFQVVHILEHLLQLSFWFARPNDQAWLSPWAASSAEGLQFFCSLSLTGTAPSLGVEMLHLTGNVIFLGGITAWQISLRASQQTVRSLDIAERIQLFHVAEHLLLVGTLIIFGKAIGISTAFGTIDGAALVALRVWFHFSINAVATGYALYAAKSAWWNSSDSVPEVIDLAEETDEASFTDSGNKSLV